jgi:hypothetical protein
MKHCDLHNSEIMKFILNGNESNFSKIFILNHNGHKQEIYIASLDKFHFILGFDCCEFSFLEITSSFKFFFSLGSGFTTSISSSL